MIHDAIARAICCPGGVCVKPEDCDKGKRTTIVNIPLAVEAVLKVTGEQLMHRWRAESMNVDKARWRSPGTEAEAQAGRYPHRGGE